MWDIMEFISAIGFESILKITLYFNILNKIFDLSKMPTFLSIDIHLRIWQANKPQKWIFWNNLGNNIWIGHLGLQLSHCHRYTYIYDIFTYHIFYHWYNESFSNWFKCEYARECYDPFHWEIYCVYWKMRSKWQTIMAFWCAVVCVCLCILR